MLPVKTILKTASAKSRSSQSANSNQERTTNLARTAKNIGIGALALGATYLVGRKILKNVKKNRSELQFTTEARQAVALRGAMNRSGMSWLHWMDGTNTEAIFTLASEITDIKKVAKEYKNLYDRVLVEDLRKELNSDDLEKFNLLLTNKQNFIVSDNSTPTSLTTSTGASEIKGKYVLIDKSISIYNSLTWWPLGSIKKIEVKSYIPYPVIKAVEKRVNVFQLQIS